MQFKLVASAVVALAAYSLALQVTSPAKGSTLDVSNNVTLEWDSVSTDPETFSIQLVNMAVEPPVMMGIKKKVKSSDGSLDIPPVGEVKAGKAYQFNLVSDDLRNPGILAQSQQFAVGNPGSEGDTKANNTATATTKPTSESKTTATRTVTRTRTVFATGPNRTTRPDSPSRTSRPTKAANSASSPKAFSTIGWLIMGVLALFQVGQERMN